MTQPYYRIRLYGHSSKDPSKFCKNLALVLGKDVEQVRETLRNVPVVVKENLERERGEALLETLRLIDALCLLEPMDPSLESQQARPEESFFQTAMRSESPERSPGYAHPWRSGMRVGIAIAAVLVLLVGLAAMFNAVRKPVRTKVGATAFHPGGVNQTLERYDNLDKEQLFDEKNELQLEIDELRANLRQEEEVQLALSTTGSNSTPQERRAQRIQIMQLRNLLGSKLRTLKSLDGKIRTREVLERLSAPRDIAPPPSGQEE